MDTTAMEYFMEIASGQTFWDVSEINHISQSSVSKAIFRLEAELGVKLFNRTKRSVTLTPAGETFYQLLRELEPAFKRGLQEVARYSSQKEVSCMIVPDPDFLSINLLVKTFGFEKKFPEISLKLLKETNPVLAAQALSEETADLMICNKFDYLDDLCDYTELYADKLYAILPKDHPLASRTAIDFRELFEEKILLRSIRIRQVLIQICKNLELPGLPPNLVWFDVPASTLRRDHIIHQVSFGQGITFFFLSDIYLFRLDHVCALPVTGCPEFPIVLAKKKGKTLNLYQEQVRKFFCEIILSKKAFEQQLNP